MPRRRWRVLDRRTAPTAAERHFLETGEAPPVGHPEHTQIYFFAVPGHFEQLWRAHGAAITAAWTRTHDGAHPWARRRYGAPDA